ncbi:MAG: hypothetical protein AB8B60_05825 [Sulfitobacter sp.]
MTQTAFTPEEQSTLAALVAQIIPASETFNQPGADDAEILDDILRSGTQMQPKLAAALASLADGGTIDAAKAGAFRQAYPDEAEIIQTLTVQCYYRDERVMRALNIEVRAPFPDGYQQQPNDVSLLDPVRARGEIYRKVP